MTASERIREGRYAVKCDECKAEIRRTDSLHESACGGRCADCTPLLTTASARIREARDWRYSVERLPNGYTLVRDRLSGLQGLYEARDGELVYMHGDLRYLPALVALRVVAP